VEDLQKKEDGSVHSDTMPNSYSTERNFLKAGGMFRDRMRWLIPNSLRAIRRSSSVFNLTKAVKGRQSNQRLVYLNRTTVIKGKICWRMVITEKVARWSRSPNGGQVEMVAKMGHIKLEEMADSEAEEWMVKTSVIIKQKYGEMVATAL